MKKEIIINSAINEVRVAITEDGALAEFFIELPDKERYIGNIYYGKINKVVSGIKAAFVNIGISQDAFLHFSDVDESMENSFFSDDDFDEEESPAEVEEKESDKRRNAWREDFRKRQEELINSLETGKELLVQVVREAYGNKGMKVTTKIALPGRYVVLLPFDTMIGVSKKISSFSERKRLRSLARKVLPAGFGCIIRTAARGKTEEELGQDWAQLLETWKEIEQKIQRSRDPGIVYQDMQLATSVVRDLFTAEVEKVVIDSKKIYKEITSYLKRISPNLLDKVQLYTGVDPIFEAFGVEKELAKTTKRRVGLPSGGDIVIDKTEAMTVIDVNSGRATSEKDQEKNALKTNMEAATEIAKQMRLRDIGGMIIVDFIDLFSEAGKRKIYAEMKKELNKDRAKTVFYPLTQLGLLQITRQRVSQNIEEKISEQCPLCNGSGRIVSKTVLLNSIERWLKNFRKSSTEFRLELYVHPNIAQFLTDGAISNLSKLMLKYFVKVSVRRDENLPINQFKFFSLRRQKDITNDFTA
ncbi:MAG: Rne/Rng family ribonuclease [Chloroflexota bacterium]